MTDKITARGVIQVLGHPPEALTKTLEKVMLEVETRVKVLEKEFAKPKLIPNAQMMHSAFVEFEFETEHFNDFIGLMIDFGLTNVEIVKPKTVEITMQELQGALNDLTMKFQEYTNKIRATHATNILLQRKLQETQEKPEKNKKEKVKKSPAKKKAKKKTNKKK